MGISDVFQALSVFIFFLGLLFERFLILFGEFDRYKVNNDLDSSKTEYLKLYMQVRILGWGNAILSSLFAFLLLPTTVSIFATSKFSLFHFELDRTMFGLMNFLFLAFGAISFYLIYRICDMKTKRYPIIK